MLTRLVKSVWEKLNETDTTQLCSVQIKFQCMFHSKQLRPFHRVVARLSLNA